MSLYKYIYIYVTRYIYIHITQSFCDRLRLHGVCLDVYVRPHFGNQAARLCLCKERCFVV